MFRLNKGTLSMDDHDLDHIKGWIDEGYSPKESLKIELDGVGIDIKNVISIELNGEQLANKNYCDVYSKIVCDFWNNN
ncbi:hypothetical protein [Clostridium paraputrificum]|uniref:hypothetical protein n=1 Tax=Clostridium paraputrificum TaxID=29363 RepID=UPI00189B1849|nr:hypothetical protein [Clostridium paraputrificum]MDB2125779.1 hypothetical protein [Clostridium paraputrificum]